MLPLVSNSCIIRHHRPEQSAARSFLTLPPSVNIWAIVKLLRQLWFQVLIGILAGVALGVVAPRAAGQMKPVGDGFIALLRLLLAPIIFCTVVHGLAGIRDMRKLGRLGAKALLYFEVVSTLGILWGFGAVNLFQPGAGLSVPGLVAGSAKSIADATAAAGQLTVTSFLLGIIPPTVVDAFAKGAILQVLFISLLFGVAISMTAKDNSLILRGIGETQVVLFRALSYIMRLAPLGAFGAIAAAVGVNGAGTLAYLVKLVVMFRAACAAFVFTVLAAISAMAGISIFKVLRMIKDEIMLVFGTSSGEVVFPRLVEKLEQAGCDEAVVGFVLPAGYSFNLDATGMYLAVGVGFIAQATGVAMPLRDQLAMLAVIMLTSKGGTTVAGASFVKLTATVQAIRTLPVNGLGLLLGIDRLMSTPLAVTNMIGNTVATLAIARWENALDLEQFERYISQGGYETTAVEATELASH